MSLRLDIKDRKILFQLDVNSHQPNSEIAKKVGLSKQVVGLRIKKLSSLLIQFYTVIDISKLGFTVHKNFLRLQNVDSTKEKDIIEFLKNHQNVVWAASCDGRFDLAFGTWAKDMAFLNKTITELNQKFGPYISERQIATIIRGEYFMRDYLINKSSESRESFFGAIPSAVSLDKSDWEILIQLGKNSRIPSIDIAKNVGLSADAVAYRIRKLEKSGVIKHYNIVPDESKYPYLHYKILISFRNISEERIKALTEYCRIHQNIVYIVKALGPWDFEMDIEVESAEKLREIMMDIKTQFSDIIKDYSTLHIYQVHKYNFCPSIQKD